MSGPSGMDALVAGFRAELGPPVEEKVALNADPEDMTVAQLLRSVLILRGEVARLTAPTAPPADDVPEPAGEMMLKSLTVRDGQMNVVVVPPEEMAGRLVIATRHMLGKAPNYVEFAFSAKDTEDRFLLTVQRIGLGHWSPHEARQMVEADRDRALALIAEYDDPDAPVDELWRMRNIRDALNGAPEPTHTSASVLTEQSREAKTNV